MGAAVRTAGGQVLAVAESIKAEGPWHKRTQTEICLLTVSLYLPLKRTILPQIGHFPSFGLPDMGKVSLPYSAMVFLLLETLFLFLLVSHQCPQTESLQVLSIHRLVFGISLFFFCFMREEPFCFKIGLCL